MAIDAVAEHDGFPGDVELVVEILGPARGEVVDLAPLAPQAVLHDDHLQRRCALSEAQAGNPELHPLPRNRLRCADFVFHGAALDNRQCSGLETQDAWWPCEPPRGADLDREGGR